MRAKKPYTVKGRKTGPREGISQPVAVRVRPTLSLSAPGQQSALDLPGRAARPVRQAQLMQMQEQFGNAYVGRFLAARSQVANKLTNGTPAIQRTNGAAAKVSAEPSAGPESSDAAGETEATFDSLIAAVQTAITELKAAEQAVEDAKGGKGAEKKKAARRFRVAQSDHQKVSLELAAWTRNHLPNKKLLDGYLDRPEIPKNEKVRTLGKVGSSVARMEFLLGRMYHMGAGKWEKGANKGAFPELYQEAIGAKSGPWCTMFSGYAYSRLGFKAGEGSEDMSMFRSGYRLRKWSKSGKNISDKQVTPEDMAVAAESSSGSLIDKSDWKGLTKALKKKKTPEERKEVTKAFFEDKPLPQAGDIVVKPRGSGWGKNEFTSGKSHTMLVDHFDAENFVISTVEGNVGDAVGARLIDLTNAKDVSNIIFITRLGVEYFGGEESPEKEETATTTDGAADGGLMGNLIASVGQFVKNVIFSEAMLMAGMQEVNSKLVEINHAQGWIKSSKADASVYEWVHGSTEAGVTGETAKES